MVLGTIDNARGVTVLAVSHFIDINRNCFVADRAVDTDIRGNFVVTLFGFTVVAVMTIGRFRRIGVTSRAIDILASRVGMMAIAGRFVSTPEGGIVTERTVGIRLWSISVTVRASEAL